MDTAKGLYLYDIIDIKGLLAKETQGSGNYHIAFTISDSFLYVADYKVKSRYMDTVFLYKINLENKNEVIKTSLSVKGLGIIDFMDIKPINDTLFYLLSRTGIIKIKWIDKQSEIVYHTEIPSNSKRFLPTELQIINDSLLLLGSNAGGMYQNFYSGKYLPAAYSFFQTNTNTLLEVNPAVYIKGTGFIDLNNHCFLCVLDSHVVYSNGINYTLTVKNTFIPTATNVIHKNITDPYWVGVDTAYINYINTLSRYLHSDEIYHAYDSLDLYISNINKILPVQGVKNKFIVFLEYGTQMMKHRQYEKGTIDVYEIKDNQFSLINENIPYPGNTAMQDTVDNKHHRVYIFDEMRFSENYAVFFQGELADDELKAINLSKKGNITKSDYYALRKKKMEEGKPLIKQFYVYKYY